MTPKEAKDLFEQLKTAHELPNDNSFEYNIGYVDAMNTAINTVKKCDLADVGGSYLVKFVDPKKEYPVEYTIKHDGTKVYKSQMLIGADLTEPQIVDLFNKRLL